MPSTHMTPTALARYIDDLLEVTAFKDSSQNGLQVEGGKAVSHLCIAVDASREAAVRTSQAGAQALLVHHGLLWSRPLRLTGRTAGMLSPLFKADCSLLAYHLPLDAHPDLGNNAQLAAMLELDDKRPFGDYHGTPIGVRGMLPTKLELEQLCKLIAEQHQAEARPFAFGSAAVRHVGVVSGRACDEELLTEAAAAGLDVFITGEVQHESWHIARELQLNLIAAGHYATETHGIRALGAHLHDRFGIRTSFLDIPTGL